MSHRDQWKMIHALNTSKKGELHETELLDMGVDCYPDTIQLLNMEGIVERDNNGMFRLNPFVFKMLNKFLVAKGPAGMKEIYVDVPSCFVVMPFSEAWSKLVYDEIIQPAVEDAGIQCIRGDMVPRVGKLAENIVQYIQRVGLVLAEISVLNANVFYELGIADAVGRDVFLLFDKSVSNSLPADIQGAHFFSYNREDVVESKKNLTSQLLIWKENNRVEATSKYCRY